MLPITIRYQVAARGNLQPCRASGHSKLLPEVTTNLQSFRSQQVCYPLAYPKSAPARYLPIKRCFLSRLGLSISSLGNCSTCSYTWMLIHCVNGRKASARCFHVGEGKRRWSRALNVGWDAGLDLPESSPRRIFKTSKKEVDRYFPRCFLVHWVSHFK